MRELLRAYRLLQKHQRKSPQELQLLESLIERLEQDARLVKHGKSKLVQAFSASTKMVIPVKVVYSFPEMVSDLSEHYLAVPFLDVPPTHLLRLKQ